MTYQTPHTPDSAVYATDHSVCRQGDLALLALRTRYGLSTVEPSALDRITALQVAATWEFLRNNLPDVLAP